MGIQKEPRHIRVQKRTTVTPPPKAGASTAKTAWPAYQNTRQAAATGAAPIHYRKQSHRAWRMNTHKLSARGPSSNNVAARHIVSCMKCMQKFLFSEPLPLDQPTRKHPDNTHSLTTRLQAGATPWHHWHQGAWALLPMPTTLHNKPNSHNTATQTTYD